MPAKLVPSAPPKLLDITNSARKAPPGVRLSHHTGRTLGDENVITSKSSKPKVSDKSITHTTLPSTSKAAESEQSCSPMTATEFLRCQGRTIHCVLGDGNCMFRSLSHQIYGTEDKHQKIRLALQQVLEENFEMYEKFWIQTDVSFSSHVQRLKNQGVWGTHVELLAATDYYHIPVCVCTVCGSDGNLTCTWHMLNSQPSRCSFSTSLHATLPLPFTQDHIELVHSTDHYDSVVPCTGSDQIPLPLPHIITKESDTILLD